MKRFFVAASLFCLASLTAPTAHGLVAVVNIDDFFYSPKRFTTRYDADFAFRNIGSVTHSVTTRDRVPGTFDQTYDPTEDEIVSFFDSVGTYAYFCKFHPRQMEGSIGATITSDASSKPKGDAFILEWADAPATSSNFDIQVRKPGSDRYVFLLKNTTENTLNFAPSRRGVYKLRGRTQNGDETTGWSPAITISVTAI